MEFYSFVKTVEGNEGGKCNYPTRIDTYGCGCMHDCSYCYAKSLLNFRKLWNPKNPRVASFKKIRDAVRSIEPGQCVRLGGMTDCFQPIEAMYKVTRKTIQLLNMKRAHYLIVTKSAMVADYMDVMDKDLAHIQISVTTLDDELCKTYEHASPPSKRIEAIKRLQDAGYDVQLRLSPLIPEYMDFDKLNALGIDKVLVEFLRVNSWIEKWFDIDYSDFTVKQSGYRHLPLEKKIEYINRLTGFKEISVCDDEDEAYEYWKNNVNYNKDDCCNLRRKRWK